MVVAMSEVHWVKRVILALVWNLVLRWVMEVVAFGAAC
jgi:hypothetical protein